MRVVSAAVDAVAAEVGPVDPVVAVGGGTAGDAGGHVDPAARPVRAPAGIVEWRPAEMTVRVLAGTTVAELDAVLADDGQCVAMPDRAGSTVGGALALGRSGIRRLGWGPVRDVLLEATVVTAAGDVAVAGGPTVKNVSGFDLCRLLVGSRGTLAVLAEVVLRTRPRPACERWVRGPADPAEVAAALHRPTAILWQPRSGTTSPGRGPDVMGPEVGVGTTWALLGGHEVDVDDQVTVASGLGLEPGERPPLPPHRWSVAPAEVRDLQGRGWIAEWGVGVVHHPAPPPPRPVDPSVRALHARIKAAFDPAGRLAPGREVLA